MNRCSLSSRGSVCGCPRKNSREPRTIATTANRYMPTCTTRSEVGIAESPRGYWLGNAFGKTRISYRATRVEVKVPAVVRAVSASVGCFQITSPLNPEEAYVAPHPRHSPNKARHAADCRRMTRCALHCLWIDYRITASSQATAAPCTSSTGDDADHHPAPDVP